MDKIKNLQDSKIEYKEVDKIIEETSKRVEKYLKQEGELEDVGKSKFF